MSLLTDHPDAKLSFLQSIWKNTYILMQLVIKGLPVPSALIALTSFYLTITKFL